MGYREKNQQPPLLDFRSFSDDSWYTIRPLVLDNETLVVKYWDFTEEENDEYYFVQDFKTLEQVENFKKRFRPACVQLQDKECKDVKLMMNVCASFIQGDEDIKFYNGVIDSVDRKPHSREGKKEICHCSFVVAWLHGPRAGTKESMGIERICKLIPGTPLIDFKLADFLSMSEAPLKLPSNDSSDKDVEDNDGINLKKTVKDPGLVGCLMTTKSLTKEGHSYYIVIENLEKDLSPRTIVNFLYEHVSIICGAFVFPSLLSDVNTRGIITADAKEKLQKLLKYLCDSAHLIISSRGRPWVITDVEPRDGTFGSLMPKAEISQGSGVRVVSWLTDEYVTGKQLLELFTGFAKDVQGLHGKLSLDEEDVILCSNASNRKKPKVVPK
ncbi:hypothetical protein MKW98_022179 [Papaver atlanticum]|uniref:SAWADEE domain-containing protein n=1 Tax=Papaver atlanticum TaxID=357466 RepID=A0AAD4T3S6_9MAGN|nr:hypothetical protein MKW98_022179 [Papaver atlanticum]